MEKAYFIHNLPNEIPANYDTAFILAKIGIQTDPNFPANWSKCGHIKKGLYVRPVVTPQNDVFAHASYLLELIQIVQSSDGRAWDAAPIVLNAMQPNIDLMFMNNWVSYLIEHIQPTQRPLIYITPAWWSKIQKGDDAEVISKRILLGADLLVSQYNVSQPDKPTYCNLVKYWEFTNNKVSFDETGKFSGLVSAATTPIDTTNPIDPVIPTPQVGGKNPTMVIYIYSDSIQIQKE